MHVDKLKRNTFRVLQTIFNFPYKIDNIIKQINVKRNKVGLFGDFYYIKTCLIFKILFNNSFG